jgi:hypothetical protein
MSRWFAIAFFILLSGCKPHASPLATAEIRISVAEAGGSTPSAVLDELQRLGFKEQHNPARQAHFRIYSVRIPEEYLVGIPIESGATPGQETIYFSGPKPFSDGGVALSRNLVASLKARVGERNVDPRSSSDTGQVLIQEAQP